MFILKGHVTVLRKGPEFYSTSQVECGSAENITDREAILFKRPQDNSG